MTSSRLLAAVGFAFPLGVLLLATAAHAQTFRPAGGPWTRAHELVGSAPDGRVFARVGQRLGVTRDGGRTWTVVSETVAPTRLVDVGGALLGAFPNGIGMFPDGVGVSADGGATWITYGLAGQTVLDVASDGFRLYAVTARAVYKMTNGLDWQPVQLPGDTPGGPALGHISAAGGTVAVAGSIPECSGGLRSVFFRSRDGGTTWTRTNGSGLPSGVAVSPSGAAFFATTTAPTCFGQSEPGGLFEQAPRAATATLRSGGDTGGVAVDAAGQPVTVDGIAGLNTLGIAVSGDAVVFGTRDIASCGIDPPCSLVSSSGLYTRRGGAVTPVGFAVSEVYALARVGDAVAVPSDGAIYDLRGSDLVFTTPLAGVRAFLRPYGSSGATLALAAGQRTNYGQGSVYSAAGLPLAVILGTGSTGYLPISSVATVSAVVMSSRIVSVSKGFYNNAAVFVTEQDGYPRATLSYGDLGSVGAVGGTTVYAGTVDGLWQTYQTEPTPARIFRSDNRGDTWTPDDAGLTARNVYAFTAAGPLHLAGTSAGVLARTPGAPWQPAGLDGRRVLTFYDAPDGLLAGTDDGLFRRDASGAWSRYGTGLDGRTVYAVLAATDASGAWLGVGTDAGLFQTRAFGVAAETAPLATSLAVRTLPNPARGARTVRVSGAPASVAVFDALGRVVADLGMVTGDVRWDASGLPAGVYVVRATTAAGASASVRAVVLR